MSCESKVYVVSKSVYPSEQDGKQYAEVIAIFYGCYFPNLRNLFSKKTDCYILSDENDIVTQDKYGDELTEAPISDVIKFLENEVQSGEPYRRIKPLLSLLKGFDMEQWGNLVCLHYGY